MNTNYLKLVQPDYSSRSNWGRAINENFRVIDEKMSQFAAQINNKLAAQSTVSSETHYVGTHYGYKMAGVIKSTDETLPCSCSWEITDFNLTLATTPPVFCNVHLYRKSQAIENENTAITIMEPVFIMYNCKVDFSQSKPVVTVTVADNSFSRLRDLYVWCEVDIVETTVTTGEEDE